MEPIKRKRVCSRPVSILPAAIAALALFLPAAWAQTGPSSTQQPASQTNLAGADLTLSVAVAGTGPLNYRWQYEGTNLPAIITTIAGNASASYSGDVGGATNASLNLPSGVAVDASGNVLIADQDNAVVRKVDTNSVISTVAGGGTNSLGDGGAATNAALMLPFGVCAYMGRRWRKKGWPRRSNTSH
jgi:hypothetical protein